MAEGDRYFCKLRYLSVTGTHQERMDDLLRRIKAELPALKEWLLEARRDEEEGFYWFYHQSWKVFEYLQPATRKGYELILRVGARIDEPNEWYQRIYKEGTRYEFNQSANEHWLETTHPILEAFWHTRYFIQMMVRYGKKLQSAPQCLPTGWAAHRVEVTATGHRCPSPTARRTPASGLPWIRLNSFG
jgi:hypothetical protein